jgi:hypothetical protein
LLVFVSSQYPIEEVPSLSLSLNRYLLITMLSSINSRKLFTFILVCLLGFTCNLSARSDDSKVQFDSAYGLLGQKWSDVLDLYSRDDKLYILSSDGVYAKEDTEWTERKFDEDVTVRFGRPTHLVVDRNGTTFVVFTRYSVLSVNLTLAHFSKGLKLKSARGISGRNCHEFERFNNSTLAAVVSDDKDTVVVKITGAAISTERVPYTDDNIKPLRSIKFTQGHCYGLYSNGITSSVYEISKNTRRLVLDVDLEVNLWCIEFDRITYVGYDSIHTVVNGVDTSVPIPSDYPGWERIGNLSSNEIVLCHNWGHVKIVDQNGVVKEEFGGIGQHVLDIQEGYGGLLVDEDTVWLPGFLGIKVLGDNRKTITVLDSHGGVTWTQCITRYDEQSVAVAYSSISGHEFGIAIIDTCTQKIEKRMLVKSEYGIYQQVAVCSDGLSKKVVALDGYGHLVSDDWKLNQHVFSMTAHGNHLYAMITESEGITKISRNGVLVEANVFPWIRSPHFAVLSNGKTTDGSNVYDANGSILATLGRYHLSVSTFGDDKFLLQVNSNTTSVVYRY